MYRSQWFVRVCVAASVAHEGLYGASVIREDPCGRGSGSRGAMLPN